ncbi:MAG: SO_0444 family Cu/Zn efflux transporter [Bacteroidaceae bacterium]|nr:SO_0444 family Cu/Zn efflux transporter [Bacteroidaceae bacterium]
MDYVLDILMAVLGIVNEMSPYLLLGFLLAGIMHAFIPDGWYTKYLSGNTFRSVLNAAIFGVPLPLCSCGVIPTAMSLRREGASKGAVVSFLIATPQTGVDSIFATYSLMGLPFAVVRPIAALFTAMIGGTFVTVGNKDDGQDEKNLKEETSRAYSEQPHLSFADRCAEALKFGFIEMMEDIGKWLVIGLIVAGLITVLVPDSFFEIFKDNTLLSMLLVLCVSVPMYICATGSIPIAVALMMKGLTPGAALVMLMAGPACNVASILVVNKVLGKKTLVLYLAAIIGGSILFGFGVDYLLPREWFTDHLSNTHDCCHEVAGWFEWLCTGILALLLLNVLRMRLMHKSACSCGHEHCSHDSHHGHHCHCHDDACSCEAEEKVEENTEAHHAHQPHSSHSQTTTKTYTVKGMTCNHCRANTEKVIRTVKGVESVSVDLTTGIATVTGSDIDDTAIRDAVESIGFTLKF